MKQLLLFPDDLPVTVADTRAAPSHAVLRLAAALRGGAGCADLAAVLDDTPARPDGVKIERWAWRERSRRTEQFAILDTFFGVLRVSADTAAMFGHSAAVAYHALLTDVARGGTDLPRAQWNQLRWGLETIARFCTDGERARPPDGPVPVATAQRDPHLRWRVGHQVFFPLVQATVVGLRCFLSAVLDDDFDTAAEALRFADDVMLASGRALEFAADFDPADYARAVRPSMTPPGTAQGLSGLMSADHHVMVGLFQKVVPVAAVLDPQLRTSYDRFVDTVETTYQAHQHVCVRFRGDHVVSLRMNHSSSLTAVDVLAQLGATRVKGLSST